VDLIEMKMESLSKRSLTMMPGVNLSAL